MRDVDASEGIFAPTLRHREGTFYLVTTNVGGGSDAESSARFSAFEYRGTGD